MEGQWPWGLVSQGPRVSSVLFSFKLVAKLAEKTDPVCPNPGRKKGGCASPGGKARAGLKEG